MGWKMRDVHYEYDEVRTKIATKTMGTTLMRCQVKKIYKELIR
jgi:hypothetical protein